MIAATVTAPLSSTLVAAADADAETGGLNQWIEAGIAFGVALAVAAGARWLIRRLGSRSDTVTSTVQIMGRLVLFVIMAIGIYVALKLITSLSELIAPPRELAAGELVARDRDPGIAA